MKKEFKTCVRGTVGLGAVSNGSNIYIDSDASICSTELIDFIGEEVKVTVESICQHEPAFYKINSLYGYQCKHCGIEMVPTSWKVKE